MIRAVLLACLCAAPAAAQVAEPEGYRTSEYRAPVPDGLAGAEVVDAAGARALWEEGGVAFVDVLPRTPRPENLPEGTIWREVPHETIPGATWLPNTGYGEIAEVTRSYFRDGLAEVTGGDPSSPILFFCKAQCWMSWNAAKRALADGYERVYWMPTGVDGWVKAGHELAEVAPRPGEP